MPEQFASREVPVCESQAERNDEHTACLEAGTPFVAVVAREEGHVAEYDLKTAEGEDGAVFELTEGAIDRMEDLIDEYIDAAEADDREGEVGWSLGSQNGHFVGLPEADARELAADFAEIVRDPDSLRQR